MTLPDSFKQVNPSAANRIVYADATDWPAGGADGWGDDDDQLDLTSVAAGAARQSDKFAWPTNLELEYDVFLGIESNSTTAPGSGETYDLYNALSVSATAATANPGGLSGADGAYSGTTNDSLDDSLKQLNPIGSLIAVSEEGEGGTPAGIVQQMQVGRIGAPSLANMMVVVDNNSAEALEANAVEMFVIFVGRETQIQDAVTT